FVMEYEHLEFPAAVRKLAARVGIPIVEERAAADEDRQHEARRTLLKLHAEAAEWFQDNLLKKPFAEPAREYLKGRGIDKQVAKYLNSPETPLFQKGRVLFGLHKSKRALIEANCAVVCEGQLDLISLFEAGIKNVVAPQGTAFTEQQARILKRFVDEVVLCFDADQAGRKAAEHSLDALLQHDLIVRVADMPPGEDPDSLIRRNGKEEF